MTIGSVSGRLLVYQVGHIMSFLAGRMTQGVVGIRGVVRNP